MVVCERCGLKVINTLRFSRDADLIPPCETPEGAIELVVPVRCPNMAGGSRCTLPFGHDGLHQGFIGGNPHRYLRRDDR
jgi:hypothetical protein